MLPKIIRYMKGFIRIRVTGYSTERFLNACCHKGISLWELQPVQGAYEMNISIQGFRQLKPIIRKTGTKVVIVKRLGLPFFLHKYHRRRFFIAGAFICVCLTILMSHYIWNINITGNQTYTDDTLLKFLAEKNVANGMPKSEVDCDRIVKDIRKEYDDIIWVSASIQGSRLIIQIKENEDSMDTSTITSDNTTEILPTDIIADHDCVITEIISRNGVPAVEKGTEVKQGDILVSGQVPVTDDSGEIISYQYYEADADIRGRTTIVYQEKMQMTYEEKEYLSVQKEEYYLSIGNYRLRFASIHNQYDSWEMHGWEKQLKFGENFYLPVFYGIRDAKPYKSINKKYSTKEVQQILSDKFEEYCKDLEKKGVEIIENDVKIYTESEKAEARGTLTVIMPIGTSAPSQLLEIPVQEEQDESGE